MNAEAARLVVEPSSRVTQVIVNVPVVDLTVAEDLKKVLREAAQTDVARLEIDLSQVSFADSNVVHLAMQAREWVASRGAKVAIKAPPAVRRLFELTNTAQHFELDDPA